MLFGSLWRLIRTLFGLAEGTTEIATDKLLTSSPEAIRAQFRKTREDWQRDARELDSAVTDLRVLRDRRLKERERIRMDIEVAEHTMSSSIELYKHQNDERLKTVYGVAAEEKERLSKQLTAINQDVAQENAALLKYQGQIDDLCHKIDALEKEEAETVAEIMTSKKLDEINGKLSGLAVDTTAKNLEAIRDARDKAKVRGQIALERAQPTPQNEMKQLVIKTVNVQKHLTAFDQAVAIEKLLPSTGTVRAAQAMAIDQLFKE